MFGLSEKPENPETEETEEQYRERMFRTMRQLGWKPDKIADPEWRRLYEDWLKDPRQK